MKLSRESEYGIKALVFLAKQEAEMVLMLSAIAQAEELPQGFLAKIFQKLTKHGLLLSYRGKQRGYALGKPPEQILLKEIVEAIEGPDIFDRCIFWSDKCVDSNPCLLHDWFKDIKPTLDEMVNQTTLADMVEKDSSSVAMPSAAARKLRASRR